jgi:hypothetical protein
MFRWGLDGGGPAAFIPGAVPRIGLESWVVAFVFGWAIQSVVALVLRPRPSAVARRRGP